MLRTALTISGCWVGGDLAAQVYEYHGYSNFRRHQRKEASNFNLDHSVPRSRGEVDLARTAFSAIFGFCFSSPLLLGYQRLVIPRVFGKLQRQSTPSLLALGVHQLFLTPTLLFSYFTFMTACRGGFQDTSFMDEHASTGASKRHSILSIQSYIFEDVLPLPLLSSWAFLIPAYALSYHGGRCSSSLWSHGFLASFFFCWCGLVSFTQTSMLL